MKPDSRLSSVLHVLLHMAQHDGPLTSETLARALGTNPVVVRRTLASLRERGYVASAKGPGGGWTLGCDLRTVTLLDIYRAVGEPTVFAMGHRLAQPACLVEQAVNEALDIAFRDAEALLIARLGEVTLAELAASFARRMPHVPSVPCERPDHA
ncbi:transcriptional regulator [Xanthomonas citri pv. mangiferaeindicae]|uniref:Rrf2 family transcriptional regulator n=1 Tax=Luteimonas sp. gir TaxID=3127960 RepID=UPI000B8D9A9F|nr:transcriptional regulator [Xanthomonas citri pv. mangiferaeindicae]